MTNFSQLKIPQDGGGTRVTEESTVIEDSILKFYDSLFNGHHRTDPVMKRFVEEEEGYRAGTIPVPPLPVPATEPVNTGRPFIQDPTHLADFLAGVARL